MINQTMNIPIPRYNLYDHVVVQDFIDEDVKTYKVWIIEDMSLHVYYNEEDCFEWLEWDYYLHDTRWEQILNMHIWNFSESDILYKVK